MDCLSFQAIEAYDVLVALLETEVAISNKDDFDLKDIKDETENSLNVNDDKDQKQNNIKRLPIVGDITKDNKRRIVIPLRYRNKRRRTNTKLEEPNEAKATSYFSFMCKLNYDLKSKVLRRIING